MSARTDGEALRASQEALRDSGASGTPSLLDALIRLGHVILDLRGQVAAARRERDAVADLMDGDDEADAAAAEDGFGKVRGV